MIDGVGDTRELMTADDLLMLDLPGKSTELVRGRLVVDAGVTLVWVIDADRGTGTVYRSGGSVTTMAPDDDLDGESVLPGFRCRISELFE